MKKKNNSVNKWQKLSKRETPKKFEIKEENKKWPKDEDDEENQSEEDLETIEELEEIVSRTPAPTPVSQRALQRQTTNSSLEMSEEPQLETQLQNTTTQTRTETDNSPRYVSNAPSYSASTAYGSSRGDYEEAGYPKQMEIGNIRNEQFTPFLAPNTFNTPELRHPIEKPWLNQTQIPGSSQEEIEEKKYEAFSNSRKTKRRLL